MASMEKPTAVELDVVRKAAGALLKWWKLHPRKPLQFSDSLPPPVAAKEDPFDDFSETYDDFLYLLLTLKKVPPRELFQIPHKIPLPHPFPSSSSSSSSSSTHQSLNLCLIIDDRPTKSPYKITSEAAEKKIKSQDLPISKVLKLSKLKSDYNSFDKRRDLYHSFDMFLADKRLIPLLPKYLGKQFYKTKRKVPVPLDLRDSSNWKEQIEGACGSALLCFGSGTCSALRVGVCGMSNRMGRDQIVENVFAAIKGVVEIVPKKWGGIRALHLKLSDSLALPIYELWPVSSLEEEGLQGDQLNSKLLDTLKMKN